MDSYWAECEYALRLEMGRSSANAEAWLKNSAECSAKQHVIQPNFVKNTASVLRSPLTLI